MKLSAAFVICLMLSPISCFAYCAEPSTFRYSGPEKPYEPQKPLCASMQNCDEFEVDSYNREVEEYNDQIRQRNDAINTYIRELNSYLAEANDYAQCEVRTLRD